MDRNSEGQKLLMLMVHFQIDDDVANEIARILSDSCIFVDSWSSITYRPGSIRVFGTRAAVKMVLDEIESNTPCLQINTALLVHPTGKLVLLQHHTY